MVDLYGKLVGKYTSPMDPMGIGQVLITQSNLTCFSATSVDVWFFSYCEWFSIIMVQCHLFMVPS